MAFPERRARPQRGVVTGFAAAPVPAGPPTILGVSLVAAIIVAALLSPAGGTVPVAAHATQRTALPGTSGTGVCSPFEADLPGVPATANPFDPAEAEVAVTFVGPSGQTIVVPAFFTQDFSRALVAGREALTPIGSGAWRVRMTPTEPGDWQWSYRAQVMGYPIVESASASFSCAPDPTSHGFLRRDPRHQYYLRYEDGTPYVAIGENLGWYGPGGTYEYDRWFSRLAEHGATWVRVWMPSWAMGLETVERDQTGAVVWSSLGNYRNRLDRAWQLDHVIETARRHGIVVQLVVQNHGPFSLTANSEWGDNPYNAANGGPLTEPVQVFTDPVARELMKRRLRYLTARWGYATNLIWEFWNEVDLTGAHPSEVTAWHAEMGAWLGGLDPYDHLQTTSIANPYDFVLDQPAWRELWRLPTIDLVQIHLYGVGTALPLDFTQLVPAGFPAAAAYGKPVLLAEAGVDWRGPAETLGADPQSLGIHELQWAGFFAGGYGTGMSWWWDNVVDPMDLYWQLDPLRVLIAGLDPGGSGLRPAPASASVPRTGVPLQVLALAGDTAALAWIRNPAHYWASPDPTPIAGGELILGGLRPGTWSVTWVDPLSGTEMPTPQSSSTADGTVRFAVPTFSREHAARLVWLSDATTAPVTAPAFTG
ncbi:MAG: DUF5060 domain-containing protein [Acidimicrobiales bacterium]|nr:DUF5060 domain-containing protein [Acidimicrobiales bacterium]